MYEEFRPGCSDKCPSYEGGGPDASATAVMVALMFAPMVAGCGGDATRINETGMEAYRMGEYEKARARSPWRSSTTRRRGITTTTAGWRNRGWGTWTALADFGLATKLSAKIVGAYHAMAQCYIEKGQPDAALAALELGTRANPYTAEAYINVAAFHLARGDLDSAKLWLAKATAGDPENARAHYEYGLLLARTGEREKAIEELRKSLDIDPVQPEVSARLTEMAPTGRQLPDAKPQP